ncbi:DUF6225 family protein [Streptomyces sp. NBC_01142]|uniref:DUF6225 family protein n=1 Tax=Streptomyces sp. NBC_01142 TaxID=2975865 RepID=UPI00224DD838|nr:DUF6225 family protein [Streptomyces sp. NBC_01142]MCX4826927.1 DUF6225 family protein [Streptomyces sp. NBC_01142]
MTDTFEHAPRVWTAGRLRDALSSVPDDAPISIGVADGPGDFNGYSEYALVNFEAVEPERPASPGTQPQGTDVEYMLMADYRAGRYHHDED